MTTLPPEAIATAQRLIGAVRALDKDDVAALIPQADAAVIVALAAMVDDLRTPRELLAWVDGGASEVLTWRRNLTQAQCDDYAKAYKRGERGPEIEDGWRESERRRALRRRAYRQRREAA